MIAETTKITETKVTETTKTVADKQDVGKSLAAVEVMRNDLIKKERASIGQKIRLCKVKISEPCLDDEIRGEKVKRHKIELKTLERLQVVFEENVSRISKLKPHLYLESKRSPDAATSEQEEKRRLEVAAEQERRRLEIVAEDEEVRLVVAAEDERLRLEIVAKEEEKRRMEAEQEQKLKQKVEAEEKEKRRVEAEAEVEVEREQKQRLEVEESNLTAIIQDIVLTSLLKPVNPSESKYQAFAEIKKAAENHGFRATITKFDSTDILEFRIDPDSNLNTTVADAKQRLSGLSEQTIKSVFKRLTHQ